MFVRQQFLSPARVFNWFKRFIYAIVESVGITKNQYGKFYMIILTVNSVCQNGAQNSQE